MCIDQLRPITLDTYIPNPLLEMRHNSQLRLVFVIEENCG